MLQSLTGKNVAITGVAGFMGSNLLTRLMKEGLKIIGVDNFSSGRVENIKSWLDNPHFRFIEGDLLDQKLLDDTLADSDIVFHLAANPDVKIGFENTKVDLQQNVMVTHALLETMRQSSTSKTIVFTSTSTVYGDANQIPTPENYAPRPISNYGASKLACEAYISSYCHLYNLHGIIYRFANIVGPHGHGVIRDFIQKLQANHKEFEILGDGIQKKSYLFVEDCIDAILHGLKAHPNPVEVFNIGSQDQITVNEIANIVIEEMKLKGVKKHFTSGIEGRGWPGDVKSMFLSIKKLENLGWRPKHNSAQSVRLATRQLLSELVRGKSDSF